MLVANLAQPYDVETRAPVQAVKRNLSRFPDDFIFQPSALEFGNLRSQTVISSAGQGVRSRPAASTRRCMDTSSYGRATSVSGIRTMRGVHVRFPLRGMGAAGQ